MTQVAAGKHQLSIRLVPVRLYALRPGLQWLTKLPMTLILLDVRVQGLSGGPNWTQQLNGRANGFHAARGVPPRSGSGALLNGMRSNSRP